MLQRFQEHQQLQYLVAESNEQIESFKERHDSIRKASTSKNVDELNGKISNLKQLLSSVEQAAETKVTYVIELSEKVISHTSDKGRAQVKDEAEGIRTEYATLISTINETRQNMLERMSTVQEFDKVWKQFTNWFDSDLNEKFKAAHEEPDRKTTLAKLITIEKDIQSKGNLITRFREYEDREPKVKQFLDEQLHPFMAKLSSSIAKLDTELKSEET